MRIDLYTHLAEPFDRTERGDEPDNDRPKPPPNPNTTYTFSVETVDNDFASSLLRATTV